MPRLTTQALALNDAYRASGAPITMPRYSYEKRARKAYSVSTNKHWHSYKDPRTGETERFFEWGDAVLHGPEMTRDDATATAEYLASAGFTTWIFIYSGGRARIGASSDYADAGTVTIYDLTADSPVGTRQRYHVDLDADRKRAAWQRANER